MSRPMTKQLVLVYLAIAFGTAMLTVLVSHTFHIHLQFTFVLLQGLIFLAAACTSPSILYQAMRSTRLFWHIEDDSVVIVRLVFWGVVFALIGLLGLLITT